MKAYHKVVQYEAERMWHRYMGGSNDLRLENTTLVAWIYEVSESKFSHEVYEAYRNIVKARS